MKNRTGAESNCRYRRLSGRGIGFLVLVLAIGLLAVTLRPGPAAAHADLTSANPAPNSVVPTVVTQVQLTFNESVILFGDGVTVANGTQIIKTAPSIAGTTITAVLATPIGAGSYDVSWNIESDDGHRVTASYPFSVAAGVVAPVTVPGTLPTTTASTAASSASTTATNRASTTATELTAPPTSRPTDRDSADSAPNWAFYAFGAVLVVALAAAIGAIVRGIQKKRRQTGA